MGVLNFAVQLESTTCATCGVEFAMPSHLLRQRRDNAGSVTCPSGHASSWRETAEDRLRKQLEAKERDLVFFRSQREAAEKRADTASKRAAKAEKKLARTKNGVCPCCNRTFVALQRHMKTKHPEWKP